jgi:hypothetical protein
LLSGANPKNFCWPLPPPSMVEAGLHGTDLVVAVVVFVLVSSFIVVRRLSSVWSAVSGKSLLDGVATSWWRTAQ